MLMDVDRSNNLNLEAIFYLSRSLGCCVVGNSRMNKHIVSAWSLAPSKVPANRSGRGAEEFGCFGARGIYAANGGSR